MAGSDQSKNLGGMLSQMGSTLGRAPDISQLTKNITNTTRPNVDPTDIKGMMQLQNWQQQVGREDAARTTQAGIGQLRAAGAKQAEAAKAAGAVQVVGQYARLLQDPNATPEKLDAAYVAAADYGDANGLDTYTKLAQIDQQAAARSDQAWQERTRAEAAEEEGLLTQFNASLNKATTAEEITAAVAAADPRVRDTAQQLAVNQVRYNEMEAKAVEQSTDQKIPIDLASLETAQASLSASSPELAATFGPRIDALRKTQEAGFVGGVWATPVSRSNAQKQYSALLKEMANQEAALIVDDRRAERDEEKAYQQAVNKISVSKPTKQETTLIAEEIASEKPENKGWNPMNNIPTTQAEIYARYREGQLESLNAQYGKSPTKTDFATVEEAEAANLPAGTEITVNGKRAVTI